MKNVLATAVAILALLSVSGQTEKGNFAISGKTDLSAIFGKTTEIVDSSRGASQDTKAFNVNVGVAYFLVDNLAVGINGTFQYSRQSADNLLGYFQDYYAGVMPTISYFFPLKGNLKPNISAGAGYIWYFTSGLDADGFSFSAAPGISYFANKNVSLDLGVQYSFNNLKDRSHGSNGNSYKQQIIGLLAGMSFYF